MNAVNVINISMEKNEGFDVINTLFTENWIEFMKIYLQFFQDLSKTCLKFPKELLKIYDADKNYLEGHVEVYKRTYVKDGIIFNDMFFL